jgi:hypothetical protein
MFTHTYIPLTLYSGTGSRGISDILPRHPRFIKIIYTADVTGDKPIAVCSQSISGVNAINSIVAFYVTMEERERCYSFILSWTPHETYVCMMYVYHQLIFKMGKGFKCAFFYSSAAHGVFKLRFKFYQNEMP